MNKHDVFLKAVDETVKEIQDYSEEELNFQLCQSKNSSFANTVDLFTINYKEEVYILLFLCYNYNIN